MKNLREVKNILGMEINRDKGSGRVWLSQENYVLNVLEKFNMSRRKIGHYSFDRSLQVILQTMSTIIERDVSSTIC